MKLEWTQPAVNSLQGIHDYIARDQPFYATRFIERVIVAAERVQEFPQLGRKVPESDDPPSPTIQKSVRFCSKHTGSFTA